MDAMLAAIAGVRLRRCRPCWVLLARHLALTTLGPLDRRNLPRAPAALEMGAPGAMPHTPAPNTPRSGAPAKPGHPSISRR
jgi:hypothetical protein